MYNVPINYRFWENDCDVKQCRICLNTFTLINRKHHCRKCGKIICKGCSIMCTSVAEKIRICMNCEKVMNIYNSRCDQYTQTEKLEPKKINNDSSQTENIVTTISTQTENKSIDAFTQSESSQKSNLTEIYIVDKQKFNENIITPHPILKVAKVDNIIQEPTHYNESTKEAVLRRKREKRELEEKEYLDRLEIGRNNYIDETKHIKKYEYFELSNN